MGRTISSQDKINILRNVPLFSCLNDKEVCMLADISVEKTYPKNSILISDGDTTDSLYIICKGKANAVSIDAVGKQIILNTFGPGDYFGEMSFIDGEPRCANIETKKKTWVMIIPRKQFGHILSLNPEISLKLMEGLLQKLRKATRQIEQLVFTDVYGRVVRLLMEISKPEGEKRIIEERPTHQEIADMVGASREMVSRILKELSLGDYIIIERKTVTINKKFPYAW
jgi:CRP/FNR family cyclic AMP-dependent transcriptional regulator